MFRKFARESQRPKQHFFAFVRTNGVPPKRILAFEPSSDFSTLAFPQRVAMAFVCIALILACAPTGIAVPSKAEIAKWQASSAAAPLPSTLLAATAPSALPADTASTGASSSTTAALPPGPGGLIPLTPIGPAPQTHQAVGAAGGLIPSTPKAARVSPVTAPLGPIRHALPRPAGPPPGTPGQSSMGVAQPSMMVPPMLPSVTIIAEGGASVVVSGAVVSCGQCGALICIPPAQVQPKPRPMAPWRSEPYSG